MEGQGNHIMMDDPLNSELLIVKLHHALENPNLTPWRLPCSYQQLLVFMSAEVIAVLR